MLSIRKRPTNSIGAADGHEPDSRPPTSPRPTSGGGGDEPVVGSRRPPASSPGTPSTRGRHRPPAISPRATFRARDGTPPASEPKPREVVGIGLLTALAAAVFLSACLAQRDVLFVQDAFFQLSSSAKPAAVRPLDSVPRKEFLFLAFYYPWYVKGDWSRHGTQGHSPLLGQYGSDQVEVAERHIDMAARGGIDAWAVSWWRRDSPLAANFMNAVLKAKNIDKIKFTMVYESKGALPENGDFSVINNGTSSSAALDKFIDDMTFFSESYFGHPSYLRINGRPVVYVYLTRFWKNFQPHMLDVVKEAVGEDVLIIADEPYFGRNGSPHRAQNGIQNNGKPVFEAYTSYNMYTYPRVNDGESASDYMFREALPVYEAWSNETVFFPHVLPKYHDFREGHGELKGDAAGLEAQLEAFACLPRPGWYDDEFPNLMFVTSFNEWWEGTAVEPDVKDEYGYEFLDTIKSFKDSGVQCPQDRGQDQDEPWAFRASYRK